MLPQMDCQCLFLNQTPQDDLRKIAELIFRTWPKPEKDADFRMRQLQEIAEAHQGPQQLAPRAYVVWDGESIIANAMIESRTIGTTAGDMTIAGLGKVCSDPARRGERLGERVVRGAFGPVVEGLFSFCLFQTTFKVRPFYEKLGCRTVENDVINSQHPDRDVHPFQDEVVMRYPSGPGWPEGVIDLRGPGY